MFSKSALGVCLLGLAGVDGVGMLIVSKMMMDAGWPYFHLSSMSMLVIAIGMAIGFVVSGGTLPKKGQLLWALSRAILSNSTLLVSVLAVSIGAAPGDVSALTSINVVFAAVMGHLFLSEKLHPAHTLSLAFSLLGTVLITKPAFIFGGASEGDHASWAGMLGNLLAVLAGFLHACVFICARKSADAEGFFVSGVEAAVGVVMFLLSPLVTPAEFSLDLVTKFPVLSLGYVAILVAIACLGIVTGCLGSQMCPAAAGATVLTVTTTVAGYVSQTILFGQPPSPLSLGGAGLMLLAVVTMAAFRVQVPDEVQGKGCPEPSAIGEAVSSSVSATGQSEAGTASIERENSSAGATAHADDVDDEIESLPSFVASEFSEVSAHETPRMRLRRRDCLPNSRARPAGTFAPPV